MSELFAARAESKDVVEVPQHDIRAPNQSPPVVITEQEVLLGTRAAAPLPRAKPTHGVLAALRAVFLSPPADARQTPQHYPPRRDEFLEQASMAREMFRL